MSGQPEKLLPIESDIVNRPRGEPESPEIRVFEAKCRLI
jgi:hypothetical protein